MYRQMPLLLLAFFMLTACGSPLEETSTDAPSAPDQRPNILFILSDDHTSQAWGIYGGVLQRYIQNPHIKRLAQEGVVLNNAFCTNSICVPSRASILTGQYSHRNGVYTLSDSLSPDSMHIAKALQAAGYQTGLIGKWHLKTQPAGFDHFAVLPGQGRYHDPILRTAADWPEGRSYPGFSSDVIGDLSIEWLQQRDRQRPFLLMTHFKATHEPFDYPERHKDRYQDIELPAPASLYDFGPEANGRTFIGQKLEILADRWARASRAGKHTYPGLPFILEGLDSVALREQTYQKFVKDFLRSGAAIDDNIGKLLTYLDEQGLAENTIVIYTADQGYFLGEHGFFDKRMIYEEAIRMPFVIRYPREIQAGGRNRDLILNIDFPALLADYAGLPLQPYVQGRSFRENLRGQTPADWRNRIYYRYWQHRTERPAHLGIRTDRYKLAFFYGLPLGRAGAMEEPTDPGWEFYDLQKDPHERRNAYDDPQYQSIIGDLKQQLLELREEVGDTDDLQGLR